MRSQLHVFSQVDYLKHIDKSKKEKESEVGAVMGFQARILRATRNLPV
jgi:hypothetical protein